MLDPACAEDILPLYLRPNDPTCAVLESYVAPTSNVILKITVPKRTGRKRKRGSQGPFPQEENSETPIRLDANAVFQSLNDNVGKYQIEPLGVVNITHRYRGLSYLYENAMTFANVIILGLADFHKSTIHSPFVTRVREQVLSGNGKCAFLQIYKS